MEPWTDPIVEEGRAAGDALARSVAYDLRKFAELLREREKLHKDRLVSYERRRETSEAPATK